MRTGRNISQELERRIEGCDPYLSHLLKNFRREKPHLQPCKEDVMLVYLVESFAELAMDLIDPQKYGLSGSTANKAIEKLVEAKECAVRAYSSNI